MTPLNREILVRVQTYLMWHLTNVMSLRGPCASLQQMTPRNQSGFTALPLLQAIMLAPSRTMGSIPPKPSKGSTPNQPSPLVLTQQDLALSNATLLQRIAPIAAELNHQMVAGEPNYLQDIIGRPDRQASLSLLPTTKLVHKHMVWYKDDVNAKELLPHAILLRVRTIEGHYKGGAGINVVVKVVRMTEVIAAMTKVRGLAAKVRSEHTEQAGAIVRDFKRANAAYFASA